MDRKKKYKVKKEKKDSKVTHHLQKEVDLTHYIHDRVELLQQAFSATKPRDIIAIAPESVKHLSFDKIKEMCLEELLGISSKRLSSVLDGTEPPSDTESSDASDKLAAADAMSLESISSDEDDLISKTSSHKGKKHKKCKNKDKQKKDKKKSSKKRGEQEGRSQAQASEAGLTVLELLELQARARAIKAQLQAEQLRKGESHVSAASNFEAAAAAAAAAGAATDDDDDDVLIKEEPPEVVELVSSDDDPPAPSTQPKLEVKVSTDIVSEDGTKIVKKRNDLTIIVPKPPTSSRIKLKRNNVAVPQKTTPEVRSELICSKLAENIQKDSPIPVQQNTIDTSNKELVISSTKKEKKKKKNKRKKESDVQVEAEASDQDEITLQLSDTEKMDLLEDFDRQRYEKVSSSSSEDSEDSSSDSSGLETKNSNVGDSNNEEDLVTSTKNRVICVNTEKNLSIKTDTQTKESAGCADDIHTSKEIENEPVLVSNEVTTTLEEPTALLAIETQNKMQQPLMDISDSQQLVIECCDSDLQVEKNTENSKIGNVQSSEEKSKEDSPKWVRLSDGKPINDIPVEASMPNKLKNDDNQLVPPSHSYSAEDKLKKTRDFDVERDALEENISEDQLHSKSSCFVLVNILPDEHLDTKQVKTDEPLPSHAPAEHPTSDKSHKKKKKKEKKTKKDKKN